MKSFESALKYAKPLKGQGNDFQYSYLKKLIPPCSSKEYEKFIERICDKIKY